MLTTQYAKSLPGIRVNAADPGYTATDLNGHTGPPDRHRGHGRHRHPGHRTPEVRHRPLRRPHRRNPLVLTCFRAVPLRQ
ncbi:hypothetical protein [Nonomuraea salmonea]|uniref:hypothetical protein n=1 Tax=Nonomuraea salmonea TaxID=46181 RepID=UPI0031EA7000